jgi:hypothetical protein
LLRQKIYQIIAGYTEDDAADQLKKDPVFTQIIGTDALASQPSLSRFYTRFDSQSIEQLNRANQELLDKAHQFRESNSIIFDLEMPFCKDLQMNYTPPPHHLIQQRQNAIMRKRNTKPNHGPNQEE